MSTTVRNRARPESGCRVPARPDAAPAAISEDVVRSVFRRSATGETTFAELAPMFRRLAELPAGDPRRAQVRDRLIVGHLPLASHVARRFQQPHTPQADLVQVASVGLVHAVDRFDPYRGCSFLSFAVPTMTGEVKRYFRDHSWALRMPRRSQDLYRHVARAADELLAQLGRSPRPSEIAAHLGVDVEDVRDGLAAGQAARPRSLDHPLGDEGDDTFGDLIGASDDAIAVVDDLETVLPLLRQLEPLERRVLYLRFFEEKSQTAIAADIGYSQMHVSRVLTRVLASLRSRLGVQEAA